MLGGLGLASAPDPRMGAGEDWRAWYNRSSGETQEVFDEMRELVRAGDATVESYRGSAFFGPLAAWYAEYLAPPPASTPASAGPTVLDPVLVEGAVGRPDGGAGGILLTMAVLGAVMLFVAGK